VSDCSFLMNATRFYYAKIAFCSYGGVCYALLKVFPISHISGRKRVLDMSQSNLFADTSDDLVVGQIADAVAGGSSRCRKSGEQALRVLLAPSKDGASRRASV